VSIEILALIDAPTRARFSLLDRTWRGLLSMTWVPDCCHQAGTFIVSDIDEYCGHLVRYDFAPRPGTVLVPGQTGRRRPHHRPGGDLHHRTRRRPGGMIPATCGLMTPRV
jgi:hypothetical protein